MDKVQLYGAECRPMKSICNLYGLSSAIKHARPQIIQANLLSSEIAVSLTRLLKPYQELQYFRRIASSRIPAAGNYVLRQALKTAFPWTICCSDAVADKYHTIYGTRGRTSVITINNGVEYDSVSGDPCLKFDYRQQLGIPDNVFVIGNLGRMQGIGNEPQGDSEPKAQDVLIRAFAGAYQGDKEVMLLLGGDGRLRPAFETLVAELGITAQTKFIGKTETPWPLLVASDLYCLPSRYEGFPNSLMEAAMLGLPVVSTSIPEVANLRQGPEWTLVPPDETAPLQQAIIMARENSTVLTELAKTAAPIYRARFSIEGCAAKYEEAYSRAL